jgi:hypothetical protein
VTATTASTIRVLCALLLVATGSSPGATAQNDDDDAKSPPAVTLSTQQRNSAGITVAHPSEMKLSQREVAFGQVLDPSTLVTEFGQAEAAMASQRAADADLQRLQGLYHADAASSLKMVQAAQTEQIRARTQYQAAFSTFTAHWGAIARLPAEQREQTIQHAASGSHLLVRASILGRRSIDVLPTSAALEVDGLQVPARVIGILSPAAAGDVQNLQNPGLLLDVSAAPQGLGPGARVAVTLSSQERSGVWIPDDSLIYNEHGARVFKQIDGTPAHEKWQYVEVPVELVQRQSHGWLIKGVSKDDMIVVGGAGSLWSLQSANTASDDDDD